METIVTPNSGNGMVVSDKNHNHGHENGAIERFGIAELQAHNQSMFSTREVVEKFSLHINDKLSDIRKEIQEKDGILRLEVAKDGERTRELIRCEVETRLRDRLEEKNQELVALRLRASLTPPLVGSVPL